MSLKDYPLTTAATLGSLVVYQGTLAYCGYCRDKYEVKAPAVTGHVKFENAYRIQMNTLENLVTIVPSIWIASSLSNNDKVGASLGAAWIVGRIAFALGYPEKRGAGMGLTFLSVVGGLGASMYYLFKK